MPISRFRIRPLLLAASLAVLMGTSVLSSSYAGISGETVETTSLGTGLSFTQADITELQAQYTALQARLTEKKALAEKMRVALGVSGTTITNPTAVLDGKTVTSTEYTLLLQEIVNMQAVSENLHIVIADARESLQNQENQDNEDDYYNDNGYGVGGGGGGGGGMGDIGQIIGGLIGGGQGGNNPLGTVLGGIQNGNVQDVIAGLTGGTPTTTGPQPTTPQPTDTTKTDDKPKKDAPACKPKDSKSKTKDEIANQKDADSAPDAAGGNRDATANAKDADNAPDAAANHARETTEATKDADADPDAAAQAECEVVEYDTANPNAKGKPAGEAPNKYGITSKEEADEWLKSKGAKWNPKANNGKGRWELQCQGVDCECASWTKTEINASTSTWREGPAVTKDTPKGTWVSTFNNGNRYGPDSSPGGASGFSHTGMFVGFNEKTNAIILVDQFRGGKLTTREYSCGGLEGCDKYHIIKYNGKTSWLEQFIPLLQPVTVALRLPPLDMGLLKS